MAIISRNEIHKLRDEYGKNAHYHIKVVKYHETGPISFNTFLGSDSTVILCSQSEVRMEPNGCIAAKNVQLVAHNSIKLATLGQKPDQKARIYAADYLSISTEHLTIGHEMQFIVNPTTKVFLICKKLTFIDPCAKEREHPLLAKLKEWAKNSEIEVVTS